MAMGLDGEDDDEDEEDEEEEEEDEEEAGAARRGGKSGACPAHASRGGCEPKPPRCTAHPRVQIQWWQMD